MTAAAAPRRPVALALAAVAGALFGTGLLLAGMTQPARIIGFLDPLTRWDPSLAFVMGGAVTVYAAAYAWIRRRRNQPWFDVRFHLPSREDIEPQLIIGAAVFGIGWGLGGLCPGPGIVAAAAGNTSAIAFVLAMLAGMHLRHRLADAR